MLCGLFQNVLHIQYSCTWLLAVNALFGTSLAAHTQCVCCCCLGGASGQRYCKETACSDGSDHFLFFSYRICMPMASYRYWLRPRAALRFLITSTHLDKNKLRWCKKSFVSGCGHLRQFQVSLLPFFTAEQKKKIMTTYLAHWSHKTWFSPS